MQSYSLQLAAWTAGLKSRQPFYMAIIDDQSRISFVNSHFFSTFQQGASPAKNKLFESLIHEQDLEGFSSALWSCSSGQQFVSIELRMKYGSGNWVKWELRRLENGDQGQVKLFCLGYDIPAKTGSHLRGGHRAGKCRSCLRLEDSVMQAREEERTRIGRELHDNVNQILGSAQLYISLLDREGEDVGFIRDKAMELVLLAIEEIRMLSHSIVTPDLGSEGLIGSIAKMVEEVRYARPFAIGFRYTDRMTIEEQDALTKLALYRIVQEQLRNILKYSKASNVEISLHCSNDRIRLSISDDGQGFDPAKVSRGLGLTHIHERAAQLGGKAIVRSAPGKGCSMIIDVPVPETIG